MFQGTVNKTELPLEILDRTYQALREQIRRSVELGLADEDFSHRFQNAFPDSHDRGLKVLDALGESELIQPGRFAEQKAAGFDPHGEAARKVHNQEMAQIESNLRYVNENYAAGRLSDYFGRLIVNAEVNLQRAILLRLQEDLTELPLRIRGALALGLIDEAEARRIEVIPLFEDQAGKSVELLQKVMEWDRKRKGDK